MENGNSNINPEIGQLLHQYGFKRKLKAQEILVEVGAQCDEIFYVLKGGFLRRFYNEQSDIFRTISFHLPSHRPFMTVNESYFGNIPSHYEIKAFQSSEVLSFSKTLIQEMYEQYSFLQKFYDTKIIEALLYENEFKARLISYSSKEFYQYLCEEHQEIIKNVPSKYIAEIMRISPEWLSKLKHK